MLFNPFKRVIGLDIGDATVKAVRLEMHTSLLRKKKMICSAATEARLPDGAMNEGEISKPEEVLRVVRAVLQNVRGTQKIPWVVCSLPEEKTFIKLLSISMEKNTLSSRAILEFAKNELPIPLEESYIDWLVVPHLSKTIETRVVLGAVLKKTADAYTYLMNIAGLTPLALEVEAMAIARAMIPPNENGTHIVLDVGQTNTTFIMYSQHTIQFTLSLNFSGALLTAAIQQALSCTLDEAERIKITCGMDYDNCLCHKKGVTEKCNIKPTLDEKMDSLAVQVLEGITFFHEHFKNTQKIDSLILSGGGGQMIFLDKELGKRINLNVVRGNPLATIALNPLLKRDTSRTFMHFATALGLGIRGLEFPLAN